MSGHRRERVFVQISRLAASGIRAERVTHVTVGVEKNALGQINVDQVGAKSSCTRRLEGNAPYNGTVDQRVNGSDVGGGSILHVFSGGRDVHNRIDCAIHSDQ